VVECWIDIKKDGSHQSSRLPASPKMPVNGNIEWFLRAKDKWDLIHGMDSPALGTFKFCPQEGYGVYAFASRWDRKSRQARFSMPGMGFLKGTGIARFVANLIERHWVVVVTAGPKQRAQSDWTPIWTPEDAMSGDGSVSMSDLSAQLVLYFQTHKRM
jgi:hypothetical protein